MSQRSSTAPQGLQNMAAPATSVPIQRQATIFHRLAGGETSYAPRRSLQKNSIEVAPADSSNRPNPASAPPCVLIQNKNRNGNAIAQRQAPAWIFRSSHNSRARR